MEREIEMAQNIIDDPKRSSANRKIAERALIVAGTGAVLYFFVMVTLALWYFAGLYFIENIFSWNHVEATVRVLLQLLVAALASAVVLLSWSEYNFRRYAPLNRRREPDPVSPEEVAAYYGLPVEYVFTARESKFMSFHVEEDTHFMCDTEYSCFEVRKFEEDNI